MGLSLSYSPVVQCVTSDWCCGGECGQDDRGRRYRTTAKHNKSRNNDPPDVIVIEVRPEVSKKTT